MGGPAARRLRNPLARAGHPGVRLTEMKPHIRITRIPYEEPYALELRFEVTNGAQRGALRVFLNAEDLISWADRLEAFPRENGDVFHVDFGSEHPDDRWAYFFQFEAFICNPSGGAHIHFRLKNNEPPPEASFCELCIDDLMPPQIAHLGKLLRGFSKLRHRVLHWTPDGGELIDNVSEA